MNHFHYSAQANGGAFVVRKEFSGKEEQRWTDPFAASGAQVFPNVSNGANGRNRIPSELAFNRCQVVAQQLKDFFDITRGG